MRSMNFSFIFFYAMTLLLGANAFTAPPSPSSRFMTANIPAFTRAQLDTRRHNAIDSFNSIMKNWGKKANAAHILIKPRTLPEAEAKDFLLKLKEEIGNDPVKFAAAAKEHSSCPSAANGGNLGEFGPAQMVKNFDKVCFDEEVGVVHGPVSTQFGEHLIYIISRTGE
uniref:Peptidyl-prolyl cis-trans isomerase n=1 Tax=Ditylum brightwellii TaxID=49249 RepID=A0A7S4QD73_9STRA